MHVQPNLAREDAHDLGGDVQEEDGRNEGESEDDDDEGVAATLAGVGRRWEGGGGEGEGGEVEEIGREAEGLSNSDYTRSCPQRARMKQ